MLDDTMTRPMVKPMDWQLGLLATMPDCRGKGYSLDEPESDQSWPDHGMGEWKESHQGSSKDTDDVSDSHHEETGVLPSSSNDTGDQK